MMIKRRGQWRCRAAVFCWVSSLMLGCGSKNPQSGASKEQERLLEKASAAIKANDWAAYSRLTITPADLSMAREGVTGLKQRQTYQGSVLKPEQEKAQKEQFEKAVAGGEGLIDFRNAKYVSAGGIAGTGSLELLTGGDVPFTSFYLRIKVSGETKDTKDLAPLFVVVDYKGTPRILALAFPE